MVPQRRQCSSLAEIGERESWRQAEVFGEDVVGSPRLPELREHQNEGQAEIFGQNLIGSQSLVELPNQENLGQAENFGNNMVVHPKLALTRSALGSLYSMQPGPYGNISIDDDRTASYLNPYPNSFSVPRPATTGYTATPYHGTPGYANTYHPTRSHWQTGSNQHTYGSINTMRDSDHSIDSGNALMYPSHNQPGVQANYPMTSPQEQDQQAQHQSVHHPPHIPSPLAPAVEHKRNSKRATTHWSKLKASSGVVSASQLKPGQSPLKPNEFPKLRSADRVRDIACPICEGTFGTPYLLQAHFPACVKRNGNPDGLFWDETLPPKWRRYGKGDTTRSDNLN